MKELLSKILHICMVPVWGLKQYLILLKKEQLMQHIQIIRITNTGTNANTVSVVPNGAENLFGENSVETLIKGETIEIYYDTTDGWW